MALWLVVRSGPDKGRAVKLAGDVFILGRQRGCDLIVRDERCSRQHVELTRVDGGYQLRDLGSANGTYVDGTRVADLLLNGGEEIAIGDVRIEVTRKSPEGLVRKPAASSESKAKRSTPAGSKIPRIPTYSMVGRMVDRGTRRARRTTYAVGGVALAAIAVLGVLLATGTIGGDEDAVPKVVSRLAPAVALIETRLDGTRTGTGSGWVLDAGDGVIVTNAHVVNQGDSFSAGVAGHSRPATVIAAAPCEDLALLQVDDTGGLRSAPLGTGASVDQGETVVALGYGAESVFGDSVTSTTGVVSVPSTAFRDPAPDVPPYGDVVQTDTALNPGNSGGPLADLDARVIGVNSAARTTGTGGRALQNVNYAISIERAKRVITDLRAGRAQAWTGLTFGFPSDADLADADLPPGLRVTGAIPGTPAAAAGLGEERGLLVGVNGRAIANTLESYCAAAADLQSGQTVTLAFAQPGEETTRDVELTLP